MKKVTVGFDLGIGSVGWSIIDNETNQILDLGSRLFSEPILAAERRQHRSQRRMLRRKKFRNEKFTRLVLKYNDIFGFSNKNEIYENYLNCSKIWPNILELKVKALSEKINSKELVWLLHDYLENRGFFYEIIESENNEKKNINLGEISDYKFPSEIKYNFHKTNTFSKCTSKNDYFNFSNKEWIKELKKLFEIQKINDEFTNHYFKLFSAIRNFEIGPGSEHSASPYGIYEKTGNGIIKKYETIWEKTTGKCSIFTNEYRALKGLASYEIFNMLEALNNMRWNLSLDWRIKTNEKIDILNKLLNKFKESKRFSKLDKKYFEDSLNNYLKNKNSQNQIDYKNFNKNTYGLIAGNDREKLQFPELRNIFEITRILFEENVDLSFLKIDSSIQEWLTFYDKIIEILLINRDVQTRISKLNESEIMKDFKIYFVNESQEKINDVINRLAKSSAIKSSSTGNLSLKALKFFNKKLLENNLNLEEMKWKDEETINVLKNNNKTSFQSNKYLSSEPLKDAILPPSVRRTMEQAIKVFNAIIKEYSSEFLVTNVVVELAREKNDKEAKAKITKRNKENKERNESLEQYVRDQTGLDLSDPKISNFAKYKVFLYKQQDRIDPYIGKEMLLDRVILDPNYSEVDHIIPISISFDDSSANKILVLKSSNQAKGQRIPYDYISSQSNKDWNWEQYVNWCEKTIKNGDNSNFPSKESQSKKFNNLVLKNIESLDNEFISRNLNDTRYATKYFRDILIEYSKLHNNQFKVICINGAITSYFRKTTGNGNKDRNNHSHHAEDASILALISNNEKWLYNHLYKDDLKWIPYNSNMKMNDSETDDEYGIVKTIELESEETKNIRIQGISEIIVKAFNNKPEVKYSRQIKEKNNNELFNSTLYGFIDDEQNKNKIIKIQKINLIGEENKNLSKFFGSNPSEIEKLLIYKSHKSEYKKLNKIYITYNDKLGKNKNPFVAYMKELIENEVQLNERNSQINKYLLENLLNMNKMLYFNTENNSFQIFSNLKYTTDEIEKINVIFNKNLSNKAFNDSFNPIGALVYKNNKNAYSIISINAKIYKFGSNNKDWLNEKIYDINKLNELKKSKNIDINSKPIYYIKQSDCYKKNDDNTIWYVVGFSDSEERIEIKEISKITKRTRKTINVFLKNYKKINLDLLGNIK